LNRTGIAVYGLLAIAVLSIFNLLLDIPGQQLPDIARFDTHVAQVRPSLPPTGIIGYYTDFTDPPGGTDAVREFNLMQYALAPVVIDKSVNQQLVVTSLHNGQNPIPNRNLRLVRDFGSGVELLRNITK
jgi:hypothetical protein